MPKINRTSIISKKEDKVSEKIIKRENMVISLLINNGKSTYNSIRGKISPEDFKFEKNKIILEKLFNEFEKQEPNINNMISNIEDEEIISHITYIMAYDFEITDVNKAEEDLINTYERERIIERRNQVLKFLEDKNLEEDKRKNLEKELNEIIIRLAKK